jgi:hypothetical protein
MVLKILFAKLQQKYFWYFQKIWLEPLNEDYLKYEIQPQLLY